MFYVYELADQNGVVFYVGKGKGNRMNCHESKARWGIQSKVCNKIRSIHASGGTVLKSVVFRTPSESEAFQEEKSRIACHGRISLCNLTDGGDGPSNPSPEVREKLAAAHRGKKRSYETRERLRLSHLGLTHSKETKAKIAAKQRTILKPWAVGSGSNLREGFKGKKWSDDHRRKFIAKRLGHTVSQETRNKIRLAKIGSIPWNKGTRKPLIT